MEKTTLLMKRVHLWRKVSKVSKITITRIQRMKILRAPQSYPRLCLRGVVWLWTTKIHPIRGWVTKMSKRMLWVYNIRKPSEVTPWMLEHFKTTRGIAQGSKPESKRPRPVWWIRRLTYLHEWWNNLWRIWGVRASGDQFLGNHRGNKLKHLKIRKISSWSTKIKRYSRLTSTRRNVRSRKNMKNISLNLHSRENCRPETTAWRRSKRMRSGKSSENKWPKRMRKW